MSANGFVRYYAIRPPSGEIWEYRPDTGEALKKAQSYWAMPSYLRDMMGMTEPDQTESKPIPGVFLDREIAQSVCDQLRERAEEVGVVHWGGCVVSALRTPFTSGDPSIEFANEIVRWIQEQNGEAK